MNLKQNSSLRGDKHTTTDSAIPMPSQSQNYQRVDKILIIPLDVNPQHQ